MSNPTTDDFEYFFNTQAWQYINNVPTMIELFNYVTKKYPQLIEFAKFYNENHNKKTDDAFFNLNTRDKYSIEKAAGEYYANQNTSTARSFSYYQGQYVMKYYYGYVLTKTIEYLYTYKDTNDVVNPYIEYAKIDKKSREEVYQARNDLQKMFVPLPEKRKLAQSPESSIRIRSNVGTERQGQREPDIFVSLRQGNRIRSSSNRNDSRDVICNPGCDDQSDDRLDKGCCKKVTDAFTNIYTGVASNINTIARNFTTELKEKKKTYGGKTKSKNKKHYSRRCKNRKNKKSCKKPHK